MALDFHSHDIADHIVGIIKAYDSDLVICSEGTLDILPLSESIYDSLPAVLVAPRGFNPTSESQAVEYDYRYEIFCLRRYLPGEDPISPTVEWVEGIAKTIFNNTTLRALSWDGDYVVKAHPPSVMFETMADAFFASEKINLDVRCPIIEFVVQVCKSDAWG